MQLRRRHTLDDYICFFLARELDIPLQKSPLQLGRVRDVDVVIGHVLARQGQALIPVVALPSVQPALVVDTRTVQRRSARAIRASVVIHASVLVRGAARNANARELDVSLRCNVISDAKHA